MYYIMSIALRDIMNYFVDIFAYRV